MKVIRVFFFFFFFFDDYKFLKDYLIILVKINEDIIPVHLPPISIDPVDAALMPVVDYGMDISTIITPVSTGNDKGAFGFLHYASDDVIQKLEKKKQSQEKSELYFFFLQIFS
jgi:hypothetical protein